MGKEVDKMGIENEQGIESYTRLKIPTISPLGHRHEEIITYTNPENGFTATFQWGGYRGVYCLVKNPTVSLITSKI